MVHEILPVGMLACNCSVFGDETTGEAIVVDPGDGSDVERVLAILAARGLRLAAIVVTHAHIDHIGGAASLKRLTGAPVWMNSRDQALYDHLETQAGWLGMAVPDRTAIDHAAREGDSLSLGATSLHVLETPGHTQGSLCLYLPQHKLLAAGDTLFRDSVGRTDLPGGDSRMLLDSIHTKLLVLDEDTRVICGHGPETTIGREKDRNPFLQGDIFF
jgi:glyoxylase-like metal-dependent hydrolase (beta-lactamase superfamily II)